MDSYDRFFPNQDYLPSGGFGNLIALPLQYESRKNGKTVFVDDKLKPYDNQWEYLFKVKRLSQDIIVKILDNISSLKELLELSDSEDMDVNLAERDIDPLADEINEKPYILSTGSLIGEGFDMPQLDTLFLTMPLSFKGRVVQYAGRLHRPYPGKNEVIIYDYCDSNIGLTVSMFKKRVSAYRNIGYKIELSGNSKINKWIGS